MIIGVPKYDHGACTAFIISKLNENGFTTHYTHPNLLFISWKHWIPSYVRNEIKKKTGMIVDGYGNKIIKNNTNNATVDDPNVLMFQNKDNVIVSKTQDFKPLDSYKPSGGLIYNQDLLKRIESKSK